MQLRWIFGYGSLMWNPGFAFVARHPAVLQGYHRSLCLYSYHYRGTQEKPGLVLALDEGGICEGVCFGVAASHWEPVLAYLRKREQISYVYLEKNLPVTLKSGEQVEAVTYAADRLHSQYAGHLSRADLLFYVRQGRGSAGTCHEYVKNTVAHLRAMQIEDSELEAIDEQLGSQSTMRSDGTV